MSYTSVNYRDVESFQGLHFLRDALGCEHLGFSVLVADEEWQGLEHDHADEGQEEVYFLVEGDGELEIEGESVPLTPGDAVRVEPGAMRTLALEPDSLMVVAGGP